MVSPQHQTTLPSPCTRYPSPHRYQVRQYTLRHRHLGGFPGGTSALTTQPSKEPTLHVVPPSTVLGDQTSAPDCAHSGRVLAGKRTLGDIGHRYLRWALRRSPTPLRGKPSRRRSRSFDVADFSRLPRLCSRLQAGSCDGRVGRRRRLRTIVYRPVAPVRSFRTGDEGTPYPCHASRKNAPPRPRSPHDHAQRASAAVAGCQLRAFPVPTLM